MNQGQGCLFWKYMRKKYCNMQWSGVVSICHQTAVKQSGHGTWVHPYTFYQIVVSPQIISKVSQLEWSCRLGVELSYSWTCWTIHDYTHCERKLDLQSQWTKHHGDPSLTSPSKMENSKLIRGDAGWLPGETFATRSLWVEVGSTLTVQPSNNCTVNRSASWRLTKQVGKGRARCLPCASGAHRRYVINQWLAVTGHTKQSCLVYLWLYYKLYVWFMRTNQHQNVVCWWMVVYTVIYEPTESRHQVASSEMWQGR